MCCTMLFRLKTEINQRCYPPNSQDDKNMFIKIQVRLGSDWNSKVELKIQETI
ncbi:unnamed protein product [Paramecium octaurelia]|uniref:Uncharacterized protein n=1 Tax=Paramecium octaurelia TaxID=43137 RepID=A0A8S1TS24_PAROT|nr:unnamed protein product [Paramecium octaurelia]